MPLSDRSIALIVQRRARQAGLEAAAFGAHSLRSRFLTSTAEAGAGLFAMTDVSLHKSVETCATTSITVLNRAPQESNETAFDGYGSSRTATTYRTRSPPPLEFAMADTRSKSTSYILLADSSTTSQPLFRPDRPIG
jgi:hypothetical protein